MGSAMRSLANFVLTVLVGTILVLIWLGWTAGAQAGRSGTSLRDLQDATPARSKVFASH